MIECPNCGSNLKFDIETQDMGCKHCGAHFNPYEFEKITEDEMEKEYFDTTVFTCPQCNGEMFSTDTDATAFCSFCGASNILYSRIQKSLRPKYILPFTKTKEDCKEAYIKIAKKAFFAPKELKDINYIDSFRGIYTPYWYYDAHQSGSCKLEGTISERYREYIYTEHFDLTGNIDSYYEGLNYDASSSFDDLISQKVAPFDVKRRKEFTPAFLSGFYADTADVDSKLYVEDVTNDVLELSKEKISKIPEFEPYEIDWNGENNNADALNTELDNIQMVMFPVWFMAYRKNDRVAYATVNGQTGKVVADFPIDIRKYIIASLVLAIPIFALINKFLLLKPKGVLFIAALLAIVVNVIFLVLILELKRKDNHEDDKGKLGRKGQERPKTLVIVNGEEKYVDAVTENIKSGIMFGGTALLFLIILSGTGETDLVAPAISAAGFIFSFVTYVKTRNMGYGKNKGVFVMMLSFMIAYLISILTWVPYLYYYAVDILVMVSVLWVIIDAINYYNLPATRPLPQFKKRGGDDYATDYIHK